MRYGKASPGATESVVSVPTTIALRHRDTLLDSISKQHYHAVIVTKLGIALPTAQEETADPANADDTYVGQPSGFANSHATTSSFCSRRTPPKFSIATSLC